MFNIGPFLNFVLSFVALILMIIGIIEIIAIRKEFSMYFDKRDEVAQDSLAKKKKKLIRSWIFVITGIILFIISYLA